MTVRLSAVLTIALAIVMAGCTDGARTSTPTPLATFFPTVDWVDVPAEDLAAAYLADPGKAAQDFAGKDVRVAGVISSVIQPFPNAAWVMLHGSEGLAVGCFAGAYTERDLWPVGSQVTLVGVAIGTRTASETRSVENGTPTFDSFPYVEVGFCAAIPRGEPLPSARPSPQPTP